MTENTRQDPDNVFLKIYRANVDSTMAYVVTDSGEYNLDPRHHYCKHSPDGFAWGYGGSGPAQLAFAILADHLDDNEQAESMYQQFKWAVIAAAPRDEPFYLREDVVARWVDTWRKQA